MMGLSIENLTLAHRREIVVNDLSLVCSAGEVVALVGPNGAGKSTLLRALFGTHRPTSGSIVFKDRNLDAGPSHSRQAGIAYMPQDNSANGSLTALETVLLGSIEELSLRLPEPILRRAATALDRFEMLEFSHRRIETLSGGQRQLVYFAQALMREPEILLLDEPASALDLRHQMLLMSHVKEATKSNGLVTIVVLHDLSLAASFADRLVVLHQGCVFAQGKPSDVITTDMLRRVYGVESSIQYGADGHVWVRVESAVSE
jgi:iron complex transport system ATP-binding protein